MYPQLSVLGPTWVSQGLDVVPALSFIPYPKGLLGRKLSPPFTSVHEVASTSGVGWCSLSPKPRVRRASPCKGAYSRPQWNGEWDSLAVQWPRNAVSFFCFSFIGKLSGFISFKIVNWPQSNEWVSIPLVKLGMVGRTEEGPFFLYLLHWILSIK